VAVGKIHSTTTSGGAWGYQPPTVPPPHCRGGRRGGGFPATNPRLCYMVGRRVEGSFATHFSTGEDSPFTQGRSGLLLENSTSTYHMLKGIFPSHIRDTILLKINFFKQKRWTKER
jgi:hypothetical protein